MQRLLSAGAVALASCSALDGETDLEAIWETSPHHFSILTAATVEQEESAPSIGLDYEYRAEAFGYKSRRGHRVMLEHMRNLLAASRDPHHRLADWAPFILSDIENRVFEFAKYRSAKGGKR